MKQIKRITILVLIAGITAALFSGCGSSTKTMQNTTKTKYEKALKSLVAADIISQEQSDKVLVALMSTVSSSTTKSGSGFSGGSRSGGSSGSRSSGGGGFSGGSSGSSKSSSKTETYNLSGLVRTGVISERQSAAIIKTIKDISGSSKTSENWQEMPGGEGGQGGQEGQGGPGGQGSQGGQPPQ
jgi:hypothetical protein